MNERSFQSQNRLFILSLDSIFLALSEQPVVHVNIIVLIVIQLVSEVTLAFQTPPEGQFYIVILLFLIVSPSRRGVVAVFV